MFDATVFGQQSSEPRSRNLRRQRTTWDSIMNDRLVEQRDVYSDLPSSGVNGSVSILTAEQAMQASRGQVAELEVKLAEMRDLWMRAEAETANVKAHAKKDIDDAKQYGTQKLATDVVEAAENLRRGLDSVPSSKAEHGLVAQLHDGFVGVERSFVAMLDRNGIKRHDPTGGAFDAGSQQAIAEEETSAHPPGTVVRALTSTWTLNGRLLRPAMVIVAKSPTTGRALERA